MQPNEQQLTLMNEWLDKMQKYHEGRAKSNIKEKLIADAMSQTKNYLKNKGWEETYKHQRDFYERAKDDNRVGPYGLAMAYKTITDKMWSIEKKWQKLWNKRESSGQ